MLELTDFTPVRSNQELLQRFDLSLSAGQIISILGTSGKGKTSIFEAIKGKCKHTGQIKIQGDYFSVVQKTEQLFPWFTIRKNLKLVTKNEEEFLQIAKDWNLLELIERYPTEVSGGQLQRFTLMRALVSGRPILLCDEALSSLDSMTSEAIANDFRDIVKRKNLCCLWITHNKNESSIVSDRVILL